MWFKKKKNVDVIDSWEKLPIGLFQEINKIGEDNNLDEDTKAMKVTALLSNISLEELEKLPISTAMELVSRTRFLYTPIPTIKFNRNLNLNGKSYKVLSKTEEMTAAQFIDFQGIYKNIDNMLAEFMAIFIIPKGYKYGDDYDMDEVIDDIRKDLTVVEALSMANFFISAYKKLWNRTLLFSKARMRVLSIMGNKEQREIAKQMEKTLTETQALLNSIIGYH